MFNIELEFYVRLTYFISSPGRYLARLIHDIVLWRQNPQCSASCCITMFLSLGRLGIGVNSVAGGVRIGGVRKPSMRSTVNDTIGFKKRKRKEKRHVIFL